ncbi:N-methylhydantoinase A/oxoprolinase/acetone carboxylase beta subunit [Thermocatellispora tengchongensis]|uniref:N-methylhydantoinase A/oxoprolinase/acetone carboxylase beta subunit n=2 Tax=Thermocatellispora tengchongensis TaxID=1073253 RepID=A0A840PF80_9ACTN|nr:hydantoinase/oxoprolinase family protein [Thermocatellispora tengchongensis]MBB5135807.1 N-methylhydantoinase A/oxoprolinase/acetone carboxylase beta subunit [Thermocatellispora tengchongensis]
MRVGIDVGGTNTDAVALDDGDRILARAKRPTSPDVTGGLRAALAAVLDELGERAAAVGRVMLGTTHATNAILERRGLGRVAVLRLGAPATTAIPPLEGWPDDLREAVSAGAAIVRGGNFVDGGPIAPLDDAAVRRFLAETAANADAVAVTGVFSPASEEQERRVAEIVREELGEGVPVSLSHEIGSLGLLERENATVLNAALYAVARDVTGALGAVLAERGLSVETYFAQNDGTLMAVEYAARYPVLTIGSGPANSLRGAAFLSGVTDAIVADVGGTSTDLGVLAGGFPRESAAAAEIGGVTTNFRMPDILAIALGGGTVVSEDGSRVGPRSVGYRIAAEALAFGGSTATMTDAAVAAGRGAVGTHPVARDARLARAVREADAMVADAVDRVALGRADRPLIAVGGGAFILPDTLPGTSEVVRPAHADVANAVGAAIALASGRFDTIAPAGAGRRAAIERARQEAADRAVAAGADPGRVEIVDLAEVPLAYLTEPAVRVHVKAAGPLRTRPA